MNKSYELNDNIQTAVKEYSIMVAKTAFTYVKNIADAENIAQEVFLVLMKKQPSFESEDHRKAWLLRVTINKSKDLLKGSWFRKTTQLTEDITYLPKEESNVLEAVLSLNVKYRIPIYLHYYHGYSIKEIGAILRKKSATIGTRLSRGRKILKEVLGGFDDE